MYDHFFELAQKCHEYDVLASMNTNGSLMGKDDNLKIWCATERNSHQHCCRKPQTYKTVRKHDNFDEIIQNVLKINKRKQKWRQKTPELVFTFADMRSNVAELSRLVHIAKHVGVSRINANYLFLSGSQQHLLEESLFGCQQYSDREIIKAWNMAQQCGITLRQCRVGAEFAVCFECVRWLQ